MAGNTNTLSKKTIVAIVIAIVLLFVASLSVGIFLANRGDAEAAGGNQISDVNQTENNNQNTSSDNNQAPDQNTNIENNNTDSNNTENNNTENNNPETPNTDGNAGTVVDNNKTTNNNTNNNGTVNNAENNTENRTNNNTAGVTTDANVNQVGETTVTRVEERERLVSRDYWDWWTPTSVAVASTATRLSPTTPDITVEKTAMTEAGKNVVYAGQKITYTITVKNSGKKDVEKIEVTDKIPSNTTFESVENDGTVIKSENEEILGVKWLVDVKTGETTSVKFTVIVNENIEGTISNIAVANGEESNEENTAIITSEKTSEINRDGQKVEIAKVGDEIKYTITLNNTGKVDGITTISDKVPEGTELKANSAEGAKISDNNDMLLWENISVPAEGTISKSFVVIVKNIDSLKANKISNVATVGGKDTNPTEDTAATDITVTKVWKNMDSDAAKANIIDSIKLQLKVNGEVADEAVVTADEDWTHTFTDLPMYDENENKITYTIDEVVANIEDQAKLDLYNKSIENGVITNTFDPSKLTDTTEVSATKVWANMNSDAARENTITSIKLQVKANGEVAADQVVTADEDWTHTFTDLPVYDKAGNRITYTIDEVAVNAEDQAKLGLYNKSIENGVITNTFDPSKLTDKTEISATKVWANMDSDAARANTITSIKLQVKANGEVAADQVVTSENNWTHTFKDLPVYDEAGNRITYTIDEVVANAEDQTKLGLYVKTIDQAKGIITNTFDPSKLTDKTEVSATKVWANMNSDAARANTITSIKLQVKNGDMVVAEQVVTANEDWKHTFTELPLYDENGNRITYTIDEVVANAEDQTKLDLYVKTIDQAKGIITNTFDPSKVQDEKITLIMTKVWQDNNNLFNTRPLEVKLTVDNKEYKLTGDMNAEKWTAETAELKKYDEQGNLINYTATENTVPTGYEKVSEEGLTVTNRANELISKTAYKVDANGNIGSPATNKDTFAANETVYYKITLTNAGSEPISKTVTDEIPLRLTLNTVDGKTGESGTTDKGDNWTVTKNDKKQSVVTWEVTNLAAREARELIIKATVVAEAEYKDICNKTIDGITANTAKLFVRKDGKVPYEGSGTGYDASLYTGELGTVYLNSSDLHYDTNANLKNDDLYYLIKNNNIITDMVAKGITRTQLVDALKTNGTTLADDEVVVWYVIKNESDGYHIDGVIRKISSLTEITNTAFTDKVSSDSTIKLEDIEIGQRGSITVKSITSSTDTVSTPMDVVFVLDTSGSMTYPLKGKNETAVENSRAKAMVNAVNSSIKTIMSKNKESRVGVVGFSGDASTIIPLGNYAQNIDYLTREYSAGGLMYSSSQTIKSNVGNKLSRQVTGGTNTQSGIKLGAEMLTSNQNTTTATVILKDGTTKTITRTPLLILVTDGKPTYYYDNATATGKVNGYGYTNETNENYYYWTLRTAKYYKDQITNKYYPKNTDKTAKVFTIGIGLKGNEAVAMLDPTEKNVNACNNNNSQQKALYKLITDNGKIAPGAYSYATGSKTGEITESDLTGFLNTSIDSSTDNEKNRAITTEESKARRVELGTINEEKEFSLTVGTDSYTSLKAAMKAGYVKKATSTTYYLDLSEISRSTNVEIVYWN